MSNQNADIGELLQAYLAESAKIKDLVGGRITPDAFEEGEGLPAIRYDVITSDDQHHLGGASGYAFSRVQFDCAATTRNQANQIGFAVADVIDGFTGYLGEGDLVDVDDCILDNKYNRRDQPTPGAAAWRYVRVLDFSVSHTQPTPTLLP